MVWLKKIYLILLILNHKLFIFIINNNKRNFTIMTKSELKSLIKEVLSEAQSQTQIDAKAIAGGEISAWKKTCETLSKKLNDALVGKPMTGELVKGDPYSYTAKRKSIATTIKSLDVKLTYKTKPGANEGSRFYLSIYANGNEGQAGEYIFAEYV